MLHCLEPLLSPTITSLQRTSFTTVTVSWEALSLIEARGFVLNYTIIYYQASMIVNEQQSATMSITVDCNLTTITIDHLDEHLSYSVQISANNLAGHGALSLPISVSSTSMFFKLAIFI